MRQGTACGASRPNFRSKCHFCRRSCRRLSPPGLRGRQVLDYLSDYVDERLPAAELARFEEHLAVRPRSSDHLANFKATLAACRSLCAMRTVRVCNRCPQSSCRRFLRHAAARYALRTRFGDRQRLQCTLTIASVPCDAMPFEKLGPTSSKGSLAGEAWGRSMSACTRPTGRAGRDESPVGPTSADDAAFRERFKQEIECPQAAAAPQHCATLTAMARSTELYYVMELVDGRSLQDELTAGRRFDWRELPAAGHRHRPGPEACATTAASFIAI